MLLTITYAGQNTTELGYLLHKNPYRPQMFELSHGKAYVFYPEISEERTTAALLLDIDPIDLVLRIINMLPIKPLTRSFILQTNALIWG